MEVVNNLEAGRILLREMIRARFTYFNVLSKKF